MPSKKAVLIGINYTGQSVGVLNGCINDVNNMKDYICKDQGYSENQMVVLVDAPGAPEHAQPTRKNMTNACKWLVNGVQPGDSLFFHYSGHGSQARDHDGDEVDGYDETLCPVDYATAGQITVNSFCYVFSLLIVER